MAMRTVIIQTRVKPAGDVHVAREVSTVLERRGELSNPPVSLAISDAVALGIAGLFASLTDAGQVFDRLHRTGVTDPVQLIEAARFEQGYASPEGHAALHCLIGWARSRTQRTAQPVGAR
jgi:hypothetical protein